MKLFKCNNLGHKHIFSKVVHFLFKRFHSLHIQQVERLTISLSLITAFRFDEYSVRLLVNRNRIIDTYSLQQFAQVLCNNTIRDNICCQLGNQLFYTVKADTYCDLSIDDRYEVKITISAYLFVKFILDLNSLKRLQTSWILKLLIEVICKLLRFKNGN